MRSPRQERHPHVPLSRACTLRPSRVPSLGDAPAPFYFLTGPSPCREPSSQLGPGGKRVNEGILTKMSMMDSFSGLFVF